MLILDSNVWIYAVTAEERPVEVHTESYGLVKLFDDFVSGRFRSVVTPYMAVEIERGCRRSDRLPESDLDVALSVFYGILGRCDSIQTPFDEADLSEETLVNYRARPCTRLASDLLDIQAKDVPIFLPAYDNAPESPVVLTDDGEFARLNPKAHDLPNVTVESLELPWQA